MAYFFDDDLKREIIGANDIADIISEYVVLKKAGRNLLGLCPFHGEKTPSFSVSPEKQFYKCFGCGVGGNVVDFLMRIERLDFQEAMLSLAEKAHITVPEKSGGQKSSATDKERMYALNAEAARFFHNNLKSNDVALEYFDNRSVSEKTVTRFGLGFAEDSWDSLIKHAKKAGYTEEELYKAGLASKKESRYYDAFRNRVIFPIIDLRGHVVGFGGRVMDDSKPKYLNSPETVVFDKSRNFYGLNFAKADNHKTAVIVEGYMDVIALHQAGITNAIATLGTSFTEEHGKLLKRYFDDVVIAFDSDEAGRKAVDRCLGILNRLEGLKVRVLVQNSGKDPDEYIRNFGRDAFLELINSAPNQIDYRISVLKEGISLTDVENKIRFVSQAAAVFAEIKSEIEREAYVKKVARESDISEDAILAEVYKLTGKSKRSTGKNLFAGKLSADIKSSEMAETMLLSLLYGDKKLYDSVSSIIDKSFFSSAVNSSVFEMMKETGELLTVYDTLTEEQRAVVSEISVRDYHVDDKRLCAAEIIEKITADRARAAFEKQKDDGDAEQLKKLLLTDKRSKKGNS